MSGMTFCTMGHEIPGGRIMIPLTPVHGFLNKQPAEALPENTFLALSRTNIASSKQQQTTGKLCCGSTPAFLISHCWRIFCPAYDTRASSRQICSVLPEQLASVYDKRQPVTSGQFDFAEIVDRAFALQDKAAFVELSSMDNAPLPWVPAAVARWLKEQPDKETGLGRLEQLALDAIRGGVETPWEIFAAVSANDTPPQYWGDITLWGKINALADRKPPLVHIDGPAPRLPQWEGSEDLKRFRVMNSGADG